MPIEMTQCGACGTPVPHDSLSNCLCPACLTRARGTQPLASEGGSSSDSDLPADIATLAKDPARHFGPPSRFAPSKFILLRRLGKGGMGEVYQAYDADLRRTLALKFPLYDSPQVLQDMLQEARTAARISHPNIVPIFEVGEWKGRPYVAMEFIDGITLQGFRPDNVALVLGIVRDAALGVHAAHEQGILHHDLKPVNVMVRLTDQGEDGAVKLQAFVMDFGLAGKSRDGSFRGGTPWYYSPEQARNHLGENTPIDRRSDVYALGITLYQVLSRHLPFEDENPQAVCRRILTEEPRAPRRFNPSIPGEVETIILAAMDRDPARRYPTARAFAQELDRYLAQSAEQSALRERLAANYIIRGRMAVGQTDWPSAALLYAQANQIHPSYLARANALAYSRKLPALRTIIGCPGAGGVALDPSGKRLLTGGDEGARVWDLESGAPSGDAFPARDGIKSVAWSRDGTLIAVGGRRGELAIWNLPRRSLVHRGKIEDTVNGVAWSPDGRTLVSAENMGPLNLWDASGRPLRQLNVGQTTEPETGERRLFILYGAAFSPDGSRVLSAGVDGAARFHDAATGAEGGALVHGKAGIWGVAFSPDGGRAVTTSVDGTARLWDVASSQPLGEPMRHAAAAVAVAFTPDGRWIVTGSWDRTARLWDGLTAEPTGAILPSPGGASSVAAAGNVVVSAGLNDARVWDLAPARLLPRVFEHSSDIEGAALDDAGTRLLVWDESGLLHLWEARTGRRRASFRAPLTPLRAALSRDGGRIFLWGENGQDAVLDGLSGRPLAGERPPAEPTLPEMLKVVIRPDRTARIVDAETGRAAGPDLNLLGMPLEDALVSEDGTRAILFPQKPEGPIAESAAERLRARLFDVASGRPLGEGFRYFDSTGYGTYRAPEVHFVPGVPLVLVQESPFSYRLVDLETGRVTGRRIAHHGDIEFVCFNTAGTRLLTSGDEARLWDARTGEPVGKVLHSADARRGGKTGVARFCAGDRAIVSVGTAVALWDARTGEPIGDPMAEPVRERVSKGIHGEVHEGGRVVLTFSRDGRTVRLWDAEHLFREDPPEELLRRVERRVGLHLTPGDEIEEMPAVRWKRLAEELPNEPACDTFLGRAGASGDFLPRAMARLDAQDPSGALEELGRAVAEDPGSSEAWCARATILLELGRWKEAERDIERTLELTPQSAEALCVRALLRRQQGRLEAALEDFEAARRNGPETAERFSEAVSELRSQLSRTDRRR